MMKGLLSTSRGKAWDFIEVIPFLGNTQQTLIVSVKLVCITAFPEMNQWQQPDQSGLVFLIHPKF